MCQSYARHSKYGNSHRQIRALTILDGLIQNAGTRFQRAFADEPLLERLRLMARDDMVDKDVRKKCDVLFRQWAVAYKGVSGLQQISSLSKELPKTRRPAPAQSKVLRETEAEADDIHEPSSPPRGHARSSSGGLSAAPPSSSRPVTLTATPHHTSTASRLLKGKKDKPVKFSLEKEKPNIMQTIASASVASTNLLNGLQLINRETERVSENAEVVNRFETCKALRRQVLRYIQLVTSDDWIGSLLNANDELVKALTSYEILDKSLSDDSDSDAWEHATGGASHRHGSGARTAAEEQLAGLRLNETAPAKPPRPTNIAMPPPVPVVAVQGKGRQTHANDSAGEEDEDDDDPFGDSHASQTPQVERPGMTWRQV